MPLRNLIKMGELRFKPLNSNLGKINSINIEITESNFLLKTLKLESLRPPSLSIILNQIETTSMFSQTKYR